MGSRRETCVAGGGSAILTMVEQAGTDMRRGFDNPIAIFGWPPEAVSLSKAVVELERTMRQYLRAVKEVQRSFVAEQHRQGEPTPYTAAEPEQAL